MIEILSSILLGRLFLKSLGISFVSEEEKESFQKEFLNAFRKEIKNEESRI